MLLTQYNFSCMNPNRQFGTDHVPVVRCKKGVMMERFFQKTRDAAGAEAYRYWRDRLPYDSVRPYLLNVKWWGIDRTLIGALEIDINWAAALRLIESFRAALEVDINLAAALRRDARMSAALEVDVNLAAALRREARIVGALSVFANLLAALTVLHGGVAAFSRPRRPQANRLGTHAKRLLH